MVMQQLKRDRRRGPRKPAMQISQKWSPCLGGSADGTAGCAMVLLEAKGSQIRIS